MNSEINKKTPAFIYAKEFKLAKVLGNLQAYKLAVGDVKQAELDEASKQHGNNLGAVYGNLITKASLTENNKRKGNESDGSAIKRRKNRKGKERRKRDEEIEAKYEPPSVNLETAALDEPLALPDCLLKDKEQVSDSSNEDSSETSDDETLDFFGLSDAGKSEKGSTQCSSRQVEEASSRIPLNFSDQRTLRSEDKNTNTNMLTTYKCWKCNRRGHLPEHCTIPQTSSGFTTKASSSGKNSSSQTLTRTDLHDLFLQCRRLRHSTNANCNECGNTSNLAFCFECGLTLCDGHGHLIDHLLNFPSHTKIYSHKLQRLLKCSNSSCKVVDTNQLLVCPQCLSKTFDKYYSLVNATWSDRGLRAITNTISCDEHFHWHRMNCYNSSEEALFSQEKMEQLKQEHNGLLSEFFF